MASGRRPAGATIAPAPVSVTLAWAPQAFQVPVTVQVTPVPGSAAPAGGTPGAAPSTPKPVAGGFSVGSTVVQLNVTTQSGQAVTQFAAPLVLHLSALAPGNVPAYSHDGATWTTIPRLSSPDLPVGQADGYYVESDGSVDIFTRHATLFGLLVDSQAPSRPVVIARLAGSKLRLVVHAHDNVAVASYRVLVDGKLVKRTVHPMIVLAARPARFQVIAVDRAGNRSALSRPVVVRRSPARHGRLAVTRSG